MQPRPLEFTLLLLDVIGLMEDLRQALGHVDGSGYKERACLDRDIVQANKSRQKAGLVLGRTKI